MKMSSPRLLSDADVVVVTRHPALIQYLVESEIIDKETPVITGNADISDIKGRHVIGILPLKLAAYAASITEVSLDIPFDQRGKELTIDQIRKYTTGVQTYTIYLKWEQGHQTLLKLDELIKGVK